MSSGGNYDEYTMLQLLSQGSEYAFTELFSRYRTKVYSVAFRFLRSQAAAEEVVQDVFLKWGWLKREPGGVLKNRVAYLKVVTRNLVLNRFRKLANETAAREELGRRDVMVNDTDHRVQEHQYQEIIQAALGKLSPQQREVYRLAKEEGLSHEAIATRMQISAVTVKSHMARALQSIRRYLNGSISILLLMSLIK
jgi:RNA polymerase sigma-70 factor (family 1)